MPSFFPLRWVLVKFFRTGWPRTVIYLITASCIAGITGTLNHTQLLVEMEGVSSFLSGLASNLNPHDLSLPGS
jgi:hypothetical protein